VTNVLLEQDGKTMLTNTALFPSQEVRDMLIQSGMTNDAAETYDKLAELLASTIAREDSPATRGGVPVSTGDEQ
jgi:hypothetical protein